MLKGPWTQKVRPSLTEEEIAHRVAELGAQISRDYDGKPLCVVGVLKGCFVFFADLVRQIDLPVSCEFIGISSYGDETQSSGVVKITSDLSQPIEGKNVLLVEDIVDTGLSMRYLKNFLEARKPTELRTCSLLMKPDTCDPNLKIDYVGFEVPDDFLVGYGLDYAGQFRNLPYVGVLEL